jgi:hypothetical protein
MQSANQPQATEQHQQQHLHKDEEQGEQGEQDDGEQQQSAQSQQQVDDLDADDKPSPPMASSTPATHQHQQDSNTQTQPSAPPVQFQTAAFMAQTMSQQQQQQQQPQQHAASFVNTSSMSSATTIMINDQVATIQQVQLAQQAAPAGMSAMFGGESNEAIAECQEVQIVRYFFVRLVRFPGKSGEAYWYDHLSGAWGKMGGKCEGAIQANLALPGPMPAHASGSVGKTGVVVNGRELHPFDVAGLAASSGVLPGRWWMDAQGNFGAEGNPMPMVTLQAFAFVILFFKNTDMCSR